MRCHLLMLTLCLVPLTAAADEAFHRTLSVSGTGKAEDVPDRAELFISIHTESKELTSAKQQNDARAAAMLKTVKALSIPEEKLKTLGLSIQPSYRYEQPSNKSVFEKYVVERSVRITVDEQEKVEKLVAKLTDNGIDRVNNIEYEFANPAALEAKAREEAVKDAKGKAEQLAKAAGVRLGRVLTITTAENGSRPPIMMRAMAMSAAAAPVPPSMPGIATVQESVSVVYEIE